MVSFPKTRELVEGLKALRPPSKDLGQHYLIDEDSLECAIGLSLPTEEDHILEVGAGPGTLTAHLLASGAKVTAVELEPVACDYLRGIFVEEINSGQLNLVEGDALEVTLPGDLSAVCANIPYQISSPLIERLVKHHRSGRGLRLIVLLLQEEFAERLGMGAGPASRGPLGINTAFEWRVEMAEKVPSHHFSPAPAIHSRLVRMTPLDSIPSLPPEVPEVNLKLARMIVSTCFAERRKKMRNRLRQTPKRIARVKGWHAARYRNAVKALLKKPEKAGLPTGWVEARPENLNVEVWLCIAAWVGALIEG